MAATDISSGRLIVCPATRKKGARALSDMQAAAERADPPQTVHLVPYEMPNTSPGLCLRGVSVPPCVGPSLLPGFSARKAGT